MQNIGRLRSVRGQLNWSFPPASPPPTFAFLPPQQRESGGQVGAAVGASEDRLQAGCDHDEAPERG
jgi:hypothetical protein